MWEQYHIIVREGTRIALIRNVFYQNLKFYFIDVKDIFLKAALKNLRIASKNW